MELDFAQQLEAVITSGPLTLDPAVLDQNAPKLAEQSFAFFCWYYGRDHLYSDIGDFQFEIMADLSSLRPGRHAQFLLPRGHGKSTLVTFLYVLWCTVYRQKKHIIIVSSTSDNAQKFLGKINQELRSNDLIKRDFGDLSGLDEVGRKEVWKGAKLKTTNQVILNAVGTGGSVRGANESLPENLATDFIHFDRRGRALYKHMRSMRPDLIIMDDVVESKLVKTKRVRDEVEHWFWTALYNTLDVEQGNVIFVGTTLHDDDLPSRIYKDGRTLAWLKKKMPACRGFDKNRNPLDCLWPGQWMKPDTNKPVNSAGELIHPDEVPKYKPHQIFYLCHLWWKQFEIGERAFAQEFLLNPLVGTLRYFPMERYRYYVGKHANFTAKIERSISEMGIVVEPFVEDLICVTTVDPAASADNWRSRENDADFSAVATVGYSPQHRKFYIVDVDRQRCTPQVLMQLVLRHYQFYNTEFGGIYDPDTKQKVQGFNFQHLGIIVEAVAYQKALATMLDELAPVLGMYPRVIEVKRNRNDKLIRAMAVSPMFERGNVYWPCPWIPDMHKAEIADAIDEMSKFPEGDHDDCVDAIVDGLHFLNRMSLSLNRGLSAIMVMRAMIEQHPEMYQYVRAQEGKGMDFRDASLAYTGRGEPSA